MISTCQSGIYASCSYDDNSLRMLASWMELHSDVIPTPVSIDQIHTTIVYSRKVFPCPLGEDIELVNALDFCPSGFTLLGNENDEKACLVMLLDADPLVDVHELCVQEGAEHDYDDYIPHITLSYDVPKNFDHSQMKVPNFCLKPNKIKFEPLNLNWCLQDDQNVL